MNTAITTHSQGNRLKSMNDKITIPTKPRAMPMHWTITARWELTFAWDWLPLQMSARPKTQMTSASTISSTSVR